MKVFNSLEQYKAGENAVATIGTFDGVHLGHKKILKQLITSAQKLNGESIVISFHPHPRLVLFPEDNPLRLLHTIEERIEKLEELGIDKLLLIPFTRSFSRMSSAAFIEQVLVQTVKIEKIIIGYDHHFGKNRTGGLVELQEGAKSFSYKVEEIAAKKIDDANISSTKIRKALQSGRLDIAREYLGYNYTLSGTVIKGEQLGRKLGFPTANIKPLDPWKLIPAEGVYLVEGIVRGEKYYGMLNIGKKPTVGNFPLGIEVNFFDFDLEIYGEEITVHFLDFIRPDKKYHSLEALTHAIEQDKAACLAKIAIRKAN